MTLRELLERHGLTKDELADRIGVAAKTVHNKALDKDVPDVWLERLESRAARGPDPLEDDVTLDGAGRAEELPPRPPLGARVVEPPPVESVVDFSGLAEYVASAYRLSAEYVVADPLLADSINRHADAAGRAWAKWAESEPRVAAWLQRMMVGTPLGEVIAVHVGIGAGYFLARAAVARERAPEPEDVEPELDDFDSNGGGWTPPYGAEPRPAQAGP